MHKRDTSRNTTRLRQIARIPLVALAFLALSFAASASGSTSSGSATSVPVTVKKIPDLGVDKLLTVADLTPIADEKWPKWVVVEVVPKADAANRAVQFQHPNPKAELTDGEFMHLYVKGLGGDTDSVDLIDDPDALQPIIMVQLFVILILAIALWRCRRR